MEKSDEFVGARVPVGLKKKLKVKARKEGRTLSGYIKLICSKAVKHEKRK